MTFWAFDLPPLLVGNVWESKLIPPTDRFHFHTNGARSFVLDTDEGEEEELERPQEEIYS